MKSRRHNLTCGLRGKAPHFAPAAGRAGLTLIEILIALFVFMVGTVSLFSLVPVGMDQAARALEKRRGNVIAQMVFASLVADVEPPPPLSSGSVDAIGDTPPTVTIWPDPGWTPNEWANRFAVITSRETDGQSRRIQSNDGDTLTVTEDWDFPPWLGSRLRVMRNYEGWVEAAGANTVTVTGEPWTNNQWEGWAVLLLNGDGAGQARLITGNNNQTLTLERNWTDQPEIGDHFRITRMALDASFAEASRGGAITDRTATTLSVNPPVSIADPGAGDYFIVITSGRAAGRVCRLAAIQDGGATLVANAAANFLADLVRPGDSFIVLGNASGLYSWLEWDNLSPRNNLFGIPGQEQTAQEPFNPNSDFRYVAIVSDPGELAEDDLSPVRVDVLVFRFYDNDAGPERNRKAGVISTAYIGVQ